ncbi:ABC transporter permease [Kribbella solani]|uniref:ABC transporter permease n=1 Tax=Kribbella solani TaxID=236067 RepID=UPI0029BA9C3F|nr:ABC transporter permease [Kribbella solani]MDX2968124.1 ABC transporter permease [Kribbella solani]MDX3004863.1 ABC transporter permease [Kribbella solani]
MTSTTTTPSKTTPLPQRRPVAGVAGLLRRPELGAVAGALGVYLLFTVVAGNSFSALEGMGNWLTVAAELGIIAVPVAMLMISGEFDLSVGSMIGAAGMIVAVGVGHYGWPVAPTVLLAFAFALVIGFCNGVLVVMTGLPSFIVTLATLFLLRGLTIGISRATTASTNVSLDDAHQGSFLTTFLTSTSGTFSIEILWWLAITALATWVMLRSRFGNWICATGGDIAAARNSGVKVDRVRIVLFMATAAGACLVGVMQVLTFGSGDVLRGDQQELQTVIAAVVGGCLLTGGYGTVVGASFGALTIGMASLGINYAGWDPDWFKAFLGAMLLLAVMANNLIRKKALESR